MQRNGLALSVKCNDVIVHQQKSTDTPSSDFPTGFHQPSTRILNLSDYINPISLYHNW